jgi:hypothetical protein
MRSLFGPRSPESASSRAAERACAILPYAVIIVIVTMTAFPMLRSGGSVNRNVDFYQYAARHEAVRKSILEYHSVPLRSHWLGGGYPTIADPEDPTFNPLILLTVAFGTVTGLKLIGYVALVIGGLATYAFASSILGYTRFGALYSGLVYGICLFVPSRLFDGNPNEVYAAFVPLCLLLLGLACRGRKIAIVILPLVFYTMLSDGKANSLMAIFYIGILCLLAIFPWTNGLSPGGAGGRWSPVDPRPLKFFLLVTALTALIGMVRILPAEEWIRSHGGIQQMLASHPKAYLPGLVFSYTVEELWKEIVSFEGRAGPVTVGWIPVLLSGIALIAYFPQTLAWALCLLLFAWLVLAHNAPVDLLRMLWNFPVFDSIYRPDKYFSFQIAFTFAVVSGRAFSLLARLRSRRLEWLIALIVIALSVSILYPSAQRIHRRTYTGQLPIAGLWHESGFFQVEGISLPRQRRSPQLSLTYLNLRQDIGTIDWYTAIPIRADAVPKYFVYPDNEFLLNPAYRGEAYFDEPPGVGSLTAAPVFRPNSIAIPVDVKKAPAVLIVNQNFHRAWGADRGEVFGRLGRLAVDLRETGTYVVHLRYHPRSFYVGLAFTTATLLGLACVCWAYTTGRLKRWSHEAPALLRQSSRAILMLIR